MNKTILIYFLLLFVFVGCASKRYAKKGKELEQVGYHEKAADMYYLSLTKNVNNIDGAIGLRSNGQKTLDKKNSQFMELYNNDNVKGAVYQFVENEAYSNKVKSVGVELDFPREYFNYYNEVKEIYLVELYDEAYLLLEDEKFSEAELKFNEILKLDPNYGDVDDLKHKAHYEPIYRKGKDALLKEKYRTAYYSFKEVNDAIPNYKDTDERMNAALNNAILTIAVSDFNNLTKYSNKEKPFKASIEKHLNELKSPFIKIVDRSNTDKITSEQLLTLEGKVDETISSQAGKMLGVKALLTAELNNYTIKPGRLIKIEKKGYLREVKKVKKGAEIVKETVYKKVKYYEFTQENKTSCTLQFKLISTETAEILVTDVFTEIKKDKIHYVEFSGDSKNLVKGSWESLKKDSPKDKVKDDYSNNNELQGLLKARKSIKSVDNLQTEMQMSISKKVAQKIEKYDPEK